jgi:hypothetical protein
VLGEVADGVVKALLSDRVNDLLREWLEEHLLVDPVEKLGRHEPTQRLLGLGHQGSAV